jgi:hypothetical protein
VSSMCESIGGTKALKRQLAIANGKVELHQSESNTAQGNYLRVAAEQRLQTKHTEEQRLLLEQCQHDLDDGDIKHKETRAELAATLRVSAQKVIQAKKETADVRLATVEEYTAHIDQLDAALHNVVTVSEQRVIDAENKSDKLIEEHSILVEQYTDTITHTLGTLAAKTNEVKRLEELSALSEKRVAAAEKETSDLLSDNERRFAEYRVKTGLQIKRLEEDACAFDASVNHAVDLCITRHALETTIVKPVDIDHIGQLNKLLAAQTRIISLAEDKHAKTRGELEIVEATIATTECAVCLTSNADHALACGHMYCKSCVAALKEWSTNQFDKNIKCPICKVSRSPDALKVYADH